MHALSLLPPSMAFSSHLSLEWLVCCLGSRRSPGGAPGIQLWGLGWDWGCRLDWGCWLDWGSHGSIGGRLGVGGANTPHVIIIRVIVVEGDVVVEGDPPFRCPEPGIPSCRIPGWNLVQKPPIPDSCSATTINLDPVLPEWESLHNYSSPVPLCPTDCCLVLNPDSVPNHQGKKLFAAFVVGSFHPGMAFGQTELSFLSVQDELSVQLIELFRSRESITEMAS